MAGRSWNDASYLSSSLDSAYSEMSKHYGYEAKHSAGREYSPSYNDSSRCHTRARRDFTDIQKHSSVYDSLGRNGYDSGVRRDGRYGYRSSSPKMCRGAQINPEMTSVFNRIKSAPSSGNWRSKSWEPSVNGARDISMSREHYRHRDYSTARETSLIRDRLRDRSLNARDYTPPRDYAKIGSVGRDPYPLPPTASKKQECFPFTTKSPAQDFTSILTTSTDSNSNARIRSNSFIDIKDTHAPLQITPGPRRRHQTLRYGVSENDLERARSVVSSSGRLSDDLSVPITSDSHSNKRAFQHSFPDMFNELSDNSLDLNNSSLSLKRGDTCLPFRSLASSGSAHVSFLSPAVEHSAHLPTFSSMASSLPTSHLSLSPMYSSFSPNTCMLKTHPTSSLSSSTSSNAQPFSNSKAAGQNAETFKLLPKHYMDAIHTLTPQYELNVLSCSSQILEDKSGNDKSNDCLSKQPTDLIDDILKLWEESQAENSRLRLEMNSLRLELKTTKHQLETAFQTSTSNSVSDNQKEEKMVMEKKLLNMEEKIKLLTTTDNVTDQKVSQLKEDNNRLREENAGLIRVMSSLSK